MFESQYSLLTISSHFSEKPHTGGKTSHAASYPAGICLLKIGSRNTYNVLNLFKVNNKDTRTTPLTSF